MNYMCSCRRNARELDDVVFARVSWFLHASLCAVLHIHTHTRTRKLAWRIANRHHILPCANDYPTTFLSILYLESYQVEHYMSLGNLATDTFLRSQMSACASGFMGVPLSLLASFPRIRSLCPVGEGTAKSRDDVIAEILLDSKDVLVENQQVHCVWYL